MVKILFPRGIYIIVGESMEKEINSSIRFINFIDYTDKIPAQNTVWLLRGRRITVRGGTIQDITIITSHPGHKRKGKTEMTNLEPRNGMGGGSPSTPFPSTSSHVSEFSLKFPPPEIGKLPLPLPFPFFTSL